MAEGRATHLAIAGMLAALAVTDLILCRRLGWSLLHWTSFALALAVFAGIALFYHWRDRGEQIKRAAYWLLLTSLCAVAGTILAYAAAARGGPSYDPAFAAIDADLGFHWTGWFRFLQHEPLLWTILLIAYISLMPQMMASILYFCWCRRDGRNSELVLHSLVALLITLALFSLLPAIGPGAAEPEIQALYVTQLIRLRSGTVTAIDMSNLAGIISFPSYHAVMACLLTYAHRGMRLFWPIAVINTLMLVATPSHGGHYVVDVIAGVVIALLTIAAIRTAQPRRGLVVPAANA